MLGCQRRNHERTCSGMTALIENSAEISAPRHWVLFLGLGAERHCSIIEERTTLQVAHEVAFDCSEPVSVRLCQRGGREEG
jgi:hypothetical protein